LFFLLSGIGYIIWFVLSDFILGKEQEYYWIIIIFGIIPQILLLDFILGFFEVSLKIRSMIALLTVVLIILHFIFPENFIYIGVSSIKMFSNIGLFLKNWQKNNDKKSLGFSLGLLANLFAFFLQPSPNGILLILAGLIWIYTFLIFKANK